MTKNRIVSLVLIALISVGVLFIGDSIMDSGATIAQGLVDGTYEGVSDLGMHPGLKVHVEVKDGIIVDIKVVSHGETPGISDPAISGIPEAIIAAQGLEVDVVSGATMTSNAILEAVKIALESEPGVSAPVMEFADGVYEGVSDAGMYPGLKVQVTVEGGKIVEVKVLAHEETPGISDPAISGVPEAIVAANSYEVDAVSGATFTSKAIMEAVKLALEAGPVGSGGTDKIPSDIVYVDGVYEGVSDEGMYPGLKVEVTIEGGKITGVKVVAHEETPGISDPAISGVPEAIVSANSYDVDVVSGATYTSKAIMDAVKVALQDAITSGEPVEAVSYTDGVYEGISDEGMYPGLKVEVTVEGGKIASVKVVAHEETPGISDPAISGVPEAIVSANSYDVDVVSGATYTSKAIMDAVKVALQDAK